MNEITHKNRRHKRHTVEEQKEMVARYKSSGVSKSKFCKEQGVASSTLYKWLKLVGHTLPPTYLSPIHMVTEKEIPAKAETEHTLIELSLPTQAVMRFQLSIKNLALFIRELSHATATLR